MYTFQYKSYLCIVQKDVSISNALEISEELKYLTRNSEILVPADVVYAAQVIENLAFVTSVPLEVSDNMPEVNT